MNFEEKDVAWKLYQNSVANQENIRRSVLEAAHRESAGVSKPRSAARRIALRFATGSLAACAAFCLLVNVNGSFAKAVNNIPALSSLARLVTFRQWDFADDAATIHGELPAVENTGNTELESSLNAMIELKLNSLEEKAKADAVEYRKNWLEMGNAEADFTPLKYTFDYETYSTSNGVLSFVIRQLKTITTNTVDTYTTLYYYTLDTASGKDLTLADLLGENWKSAVSSAVDTQILRSNDARRISYYKEFWTDKNISIDDSQLFYVNADGTVTVVFNEGEIAPFEDGPQFFKIG